MASRKIPVISQIAVSLCRVGISLVTFFVPAKKVTRPLGRKLLASKQEEQRQSPWIPAFAGMTAE
jgi:hypothetical protein